MVKSMKNYQELAVRLQAIENCIKSNNEEWQDRHEEVIEAIMNTAPSGSGFNAGTQFEQEISDSRKLVFKTAFHHSDQDGYYDGWTYHSIIITPAFVGFEVKVTGRNKNDIKEYIADTFTEWLMEEANS